MIKLVFKAYKKTDKIIFYNFVFLYIIFITGYYQKNKERLSKKARERYEIFLRKEKQKMLICS